MGVFFKKGLRNLQNESPAGVIDRGIKTGILFHYIGKQVDGDDFTHLLVQQLGPAFNRDGRRGNVGGFTRIEDCVQQCADRVVECRQPDLFRVGLRRVL